MPEEGISTSPFSRWGIMWVHPNLVKDKGQWTTISKPSDRGKTKSCHMVNALAMETDSDDSSLFYIDDEEIPATSDRMPLATTTSRQDAWGVPSIRSPPDARGFPFSSIASPHKWNSFKEEHVVALFNLLNIHNKLKLLAAQRPEEVGRTGHPKYCLFH